MTHDNKIDALFTPDSIAFIGASENNARFQSMYDNLTEYDDSRETYFVNPNRESVYGEPCFDTINEVPTSVDLAIIIVPASIVPTVFEGCCTADVSAAIVVSAGFGEAGESGREMERKLTELSEKYDLPFCGPNSYGVLSVHDRTAAAQVSTLDIEKGNVAAILQSGGLLNQVLYSGMERGFGFSKVIDSGNEASLSTSHYMDYLIDDEHTEVVIGIIEGISHPKQFVNAAKKATRRGVPLIVLKLARSDRGQTVAASHTGAVTSSDEVTSAVFNQYGVIQAESLDLLIELAELFSKVPDPGGNGIGVLEISGGGCTLFTDVIADSELKLADLSADAEERISQSLPAIGRARNPVDMAMGWGSEGMEQAHPEALDALATEPEIDIILSRLSIPMDGDLGSIGQRLADIERMDAKHEETFVVTSRTSGRVSSEWTEQISDTSIPFLQEYHKSIEALSSAAWYSAFQRREESATTDDTPLEDVDRIDQKVTEHDAKRMLESVNITAADEVLATTEQETLDAAERIGYPVCMKIVSFDIPHKTEVGGVRTGITSPDQVRHAYQEIVESVTTSKPDAQIEGILVQEMITDGVELLVGSKRTPFGQAVVIGLGGVFTEILDEAEIRISPFSTVTARETLETTRGYEVLEGAREQDAVAISELAALISRYSQFVAAHSEIVESDLNPVIATPERAYVVDALFHVSDS